jgi:hypothetical protein
VIGCVMADHSVRGLDWCDGGKGVWMDDGKGKGIVRLCVCWARVGAWLCYVGLGWDGMSSDRSCSCRCG